MRHTSEVKLMGAEPVPCNIQISATNNGVIIKLQCI